MAEQKNNDTNNEKEPVIVTDDNWKQQAKKEKEKLEQQEQEAKQQDVQSVAIPPASFLTLINSLTVQALFSLGRISDPSVKETPPVNLKLAKFNIDLLQVLEDKTKGNLSEQEKQAISVSLQELRMQYVQEAAKQ